MFLIPSFIAPQDMYARGTFQPTVDVQQDLKNTAVWTTTSAAGQGLVATWSRMMKTNDPNLGEDTDIPAAGQPVQMFFHGFPIQLR